MIKEYCNICSNGTHYFLEEKILNEDWEEFEAYICFTCIARLHFDMTKRIDFENIDINEVMKEK